MALPRVAHADDVDDFIFAVSAYLNAEYPVAIARLEPLVGEDPPRLRSDLVESARRYLAASLVQTGEEQRAARVMLQILRMNPDADFNARDFTPGTIRLFQSTRAAHGPELDEIREQRRRVAAEAERRRARQRELVTAMLTIERIPAPRARWPVFIPFGVGQFYNGDPGMGLVFAVLPTLGILSGIAGAVAIPACPPSAEYALEPSQSCIIAGNVLMLSGFAGAAIALGAGIIHANLTFGAERTVIRRRSLPPELRNLRISAAPPPTGQGLLLGASFRF